MMRGQLQKTASTEVAAWRVVAASAAGKKAETIGSPCQDAYDFRLLPGDILIAAVADGASSASQSALGATVAVQAAVNGMTQRAIRPLPGDDRDAWEELLASACRVAKCTVEMKAEEVGVKSGELACTLILAIATAERVAVAQIGDGAAVARDAGGNVFALTQPQRGEFANDVVCLVSPNALEQAERRIHPNPVTHLALFTDGLQRMALQMPTGTPYAPFFEPLFDFASDANDEADAKTQLESFLKSPRVSERTDDDVTLLLAALQF